MCQNPKTIKQHELANITTQPQEQHNVTKTMIKKQMCQRFQTFQLQTKVRHEASLTICSRKHNYLIQNHTKIDRLY